MRPGLGIALIDAATNCSRDGATATVTLKSGVRISGKLQRPTMADPPDAHIQKDDGGWATIDTNEIAAVETQR